MPNSRRKYSSQNWNRAEENRRSQSSAGRQGLSQEQGAIQRQSQGAGQSNKSLSSYSDNILSFPAPYFAPFLSFFSEIDRAFNKGFRNLGLPALPDVFEGQGAFSPNVDILSNENEYIITAEVPGIDERDMRVEVCEDGTLCISGVKRQESQERRGSAECIECSYGAFERNLSLPEDASRENIEASFRNGVLTVICPRIEGRRAQSRQVDINSGNGAPERGAAANDRGNSATHERNISSERERASHEKGASQGPKRAA